MKVKSPLGASIESPAASPLDQINSAPLSSTTTPSDKTLVSTDKSMEEPFQYENQLKYLMECGFDKDDAKLALTALKGNVELALNVLPLVIFYITWNRMRLVEKVLSIQ
jgi:hypothetical protein